MSDPVGVLDVLLGAAVLGAAVLAVVLPRREAAVAVFLVFGVFLAVLWARLDAPDIALAEAVLGGGVAGALLVDALSSRTPGGTPRRAPGPVIAVAVAAGAVLLAALVTVVRSLPTSPGELPALVADRMGETGVDHGVTAVLLNYRSYDTLLEIAVLVLAALGASAVAGGSTRAVPADPGPVLRGLVVVLLPVTVLLAGWLLVAGTSRPGGAFQAGAVLGAALVVAHLAGVPGASSYGVAGTVGVVGGLLVFVALAVGTAVAGGGWLVLDLDWAGTAILALETVLALSIGVGLLRLFAATRADTGGAR